MSSAMHRMNQRPYSPFRGIVKKIRNRIIHTLPAVATVSKALISPFLWDLNISGNINPNMVSKTIHPIVKMNHR